MLIKEERLLKRIDELLSVQNPDEVYTGALTIASSLYGMNSPQVDNIKGMAPKWTEAEDIRLHRQLKGWKLQSLRAGLRAFRGDIEAGLVKSMQAEARGEVLADFVTLSRHALEEGEKEVAAVLACAALENSLRRYAELNDLDVEGKDISDVISALQSKGLVKGAQGRLLISFTPICHKAFHAEWDKLDKSEVQSVIGFVEQFLVANF